MDSQIAREATPRPVNEKGNCVVLATAQPDTLRIATQPFPEPRMAMKSAQREPARHRLQPGTGEIVVTVETCETEEYVTVEQILGDMRLMKPVKKAWAWAGGQPF